MQASHREGSPSKLETGVMQIAETLQTMGTQRLVLIDSNTVVARELESPASLREIPETGPSDASADLPAMMLAALDHIHANQLGQTEVWICSDLREFDWRPQDGRWASLRDAFGELGRRVRFRLLAFSQPSQGNLSVRVEEAKLTTVDGDPVVSVSLRIQVDSTQTDSPTHVENVPVTLDLAGTRSTVDVNLHQGVGHLNGHRVALPRGQTRGWGHVSLPADRNLADND